MFRAGEKIKIKEDATDVPHECGFNSEMESYKGEIFTISQKSGSGQYNWKLKGNAWIWHESWFEKLHNFKNIEKII